MKTSSPSTLSHDQKRLVVLASGAGTLFAAIAEACQNQTLAAQVIHLISDNKKAPAIQKSQHDGIPTSILRPQDYGSLQAWDQDLYHVCAAQNPHLIIMAGFLKKLGPQMLSSFHNRILNIHPSLLPRHGGAGMYGIHVHQSVIAHKDTHTGISVHLASKEYDTGPILAQKVISVSLTDTAESLQEKIKQIEKSFYVSVLQQILQGKITLPETMHTLPT